MAQIKAFIVNLMTGLCVTLIFCVWCVAKLLQLLGAAGDGIEALMLLWLR